MPAHRSAARGPAPEGVPEMPAPRVRESAAHSIGTLHR